jgi:Protein of unknown function (DUF1264)
LKRIFLFSLLVFTITGFVLAQNAKTPADGYTVHVTAKHLVNGHEMGPFHHFCKVMSDDPVIVCQIYDSADPNAMMSQVEFIIAKKLTRPSVPLATWNKLWHDHAVEIATGNVKVLDVSDEQAKQVADLVSTTDGIIYSFEFDKSGKVPTGTVIHAQAVGHKPMSAADYKKSAEMKP